MKLNKSVALVICTDLPEIPPPNPSARLGWEFRLVKFSKLKPGALIAVEEAGVPYLFITRYDPHSVYLGDRRVKTSLMSRPDGHWEVYESRRYYYNSWSPT